MTGVVTVTMSRIIIDRQANIERYGMSSLVKSDLRASRYRISVLMKNGGVILLHWRTQAARDSAYDQLADEITRFKDAPLPRGTDRGL